MSTDLSELFARDPLLHSQQDIQKIIDTLRAARVNFNLGQKQAGSMKPKAEPKAKAEKISKDEAANFLKSLGL